ncbi:hypothetical protein [Lelliottia aquatilis]|uniref:hypothetical protein n=1 Tax=Lelliottia aquatilis TaxID=2080838 RepID=UPI001FB048DC|nr:hypothetical protein [Lelliottia aquatilis]
MEEVEITFSDEATEAIINARRPSLTDFFSAFFDKIAMQKTGYHYSLPRTFKPSDAALATRDHIPRDLPPDELIDAPCEAYPSSTERTGLQCCMVK